MLPHFWFVRVPLGDKYREFYLHTVISYYNTLLTKPITHCNELSFTFYGAYDDIALTADKIHGINYRFLAAESEASIDFSTTPVMLSIQEFIEASGEYDNFIRSVSAWLHLREILSYSLDDVITLI